VVTSAEWISGPQASSAPRYLKRLSIITAGALLCQILLGALLRHPGEGVHLGFILTHVLGSIAVLILILTLSWRLRHHNLLNRWALAPMGAVGLQMMLGIIALLVLFYEESVGVRSPWQVGFNSAHLIVGTLVMGLSVSIALYLKRRAQ